MPKTTMLGDCGRRYRLLGESCTRRHGNRLRRRRSGSCGFSKLVALKELLPDFVSSLHDLEVGVRRAAARLTPPHQQAIGDHEVGTQLLERHSLLKPAGP